MMMNPTAQAVTIPNFQLYLTVDQIISAARQLKKEEQTQLIEALADTELAHSTKQLIDSITDEDSIAEVNAVRESNVAQSYRELMKRLSYVNTGRSFTRDEMNERR